MTTTPPGWYDDGNATLRWWDGAQWTEHVQVPGIPTESSVGVPPRPPLPEVDPRTALGLDPSDAALSPAQPPARSKLWILFVAVGVVLVALVVLAAVFIPMAVRAISGGQPYTPQGAQETAGVAVVDLYDEAWREVDCQKFEAATTERFRETTQLTDCDLFSEQAGYFAQSTVDYEVTVTSVGVGEDDIVVETTETYSAYVDEMGNEVDEPISYRDRYVYTLIPDGSGWAIESADVS